MKKTNLSPFVLNLVTLTILVAAGRLSCPAIECGDSGNTYWTASAAQSSSAPRTFALDETNVFRSVSTYLYAWSRADGYQPLGSKELVGTALGQPLSIVTSNGFRRVILAGSDGYVYGLAFPSFDTAWSRSTRRLTCSADSIIATPAAQLWAGSRTARFAP